MKAYSFLGQFKKKPSGTLSNLQVLGKKTRLEEIKKKKSPGWDLNQPGAWVKIKKNHVLRGRHQEQNPGLRLFYPLLHPLHQHQNFETNMF